MEGRRGESGFRKVATKKQQYQAKYPERAAVLGKEPKNVSSSVSWQRQVSHAWRGGRESGQKEEREVKMDIVSRKSKDRLNARLQCYLRDRIERVIWNLA